MENNYETGFSYQPFSEIAEQSVLGGMLVTGSEQYNHEILEALTEDDFYIYKHKLIYRAISSIDSSGNTIDPVTIIGALGSDLNEIGGIGYIASLGHSVYRQENTLKYIRVLKEKTAERKVLEIASNMRLAIVDSDFDSPTRVNNAMSIPLSFDGSENIDEKDCSDFLKEAFSTLELRHENNGKITGLTTGFNDIDNRLQGVQDGHLVILAARPSMGKTTLALNFAEHSIFNNQDGATIFFSLEMPGREVMEKMACSIGRVNYRLFKMGFPKNIPECDIEWPKVGGAFTKLKSAKNFILDDRGGLTVQQIRAKCIRVKRKTGRIKSVFIDYLTYIKTPDKGGRVQEVGAVSRALKAMAKELNCPVICLAQLSRKVEERQDKRPMMSDLRDSGEIEQDADVVMFIYRDEYYNENSERKGIAEIITVKNRGGETGVDFIQSDLPHSRFNNLSSNFRPENTEQKTTGKTYYGK